MQIEDNVQSELLKSSIKRWDLKKLDSQTTIILKLRSISCKIFFNYMRKYELKLPCKTYPSHIFYLALNKLRRTVTKNLVKFTWRIGQVELLRKKNLMTVKMVTCKEIRMSYCPETDARQLHEIMKEKELGGNGKAFFSNGRWQKRPIFMKDQLQAV